jgi:hypothetical protein
VLAFCDVDQKKIDQGYYTYEESQVSKAFEQQPPEVGPTTKFTF